jgi:tRNA A-37 threonylcarbamoyl transferase component Bud32
MTLSLAGYKPWAHDGWTGLVRADRMALAGGEFLRLVKNQGIVVRQRSSARVVQVTFDGQVYFAKLTSALRADEHGRQRAADRLRWRFGPSRALHVLRVSANLTAAGVDVPPVVLVGRRHGAAASEQLLVTELVAGTRFQVRLAQVEQVAARSALCAEFGRQVARLHRNRFVHGDLSPGNVLVDAMPKARGATRWCFLDNDRTRRWWPRAPRSLCRKNLVQVALRLRLRVGWRITRSFLDAYLKVYGPNAESARRRELLRVARSTQQRTARRRSLGRPDRRLRRSR